MEISTYGSKLEATSIAIENLLGFQYKLRMMGIKVEKYSTILGDNNAVILKTQLTSSSLKKNQKPVKYHKAI